LPVVINKTIIANIWFVFLLQALPVVSVVFVIFSFVIFLIVSDVVLALIINHTIIA